MLNRIALVPLIAASILFAACDSQVRGAFGGVLPAGPTGLGGSVVRFTPQTLPIYPVYGYGCPFVPPYRTNVDLIVVVNGGSDMFLNDVTFRFIDGTGIGRPPLIYTPTDLTNQFGYTRIVAGGSRTFSFAPHFGCNTVTPYAVAADVTLHDRTGAPQQYTLNMPMTR